MVAGRSVRLAEQVGTERLLLRLWRLEDLGELAALVTRNVEHLRPWMPWVAAEPLSIRQREELVRGWGRDWAAGGDATYGIFFEGRPVGGTGLHRRRGPTGLEIGYWIDLEHCHRGFATEAARALTTAALTVPGIEFVEIHHDKSNTRSARVPRRLHYTFAGESPDQAEAPAEVGIDCAWRMDRADWPPVAAD